MSVWQKFVNALNNEEKIYVNLYKKTLKIGKEMMIERGEIKTDESLTEREDGLTWEYVTDLYEQFRTSVPGTGKTKCKYFKGADESELSLVEKLRNPDRAYALAMLECALLIGGLSNTLTFADGQWFYQNPDNKDFVVLKNWIK